MSSATKWRWGRRDVLTGVGVAIAYFVVGRLGLLLATINTSASPVWPATGLAFAALYVFGPRFWPAIAVGAFATNILTEAPSMSSAFIALGNALEALTGAMIVERITARRPILEHQTEVLAFGAASIVGPIVSASIGSFALAMSGAITWGATSQTWITWWVGDALGGLVFAPLLVGIVHNRKSFIEECLDGVRASAYAIAIAVTSSFVLYHPAGRAYLFLLFPVLLMARHAFGRLGVRIVAAIVCSLAIWLTVHGTGPFMAGTLNDNLIHLQLFLGAIALTSLVLVGFDQHDFRVTTVAVMVFGWVLSGVLFQSFLRHEETRDDQHFTDLVTEIRSSLLERMATYEEALLGGVALVQASEDVTLKEWKQYLDTVKTVERFPGIRGVGIIWVIPTEKLSWFEQRQRERGIESFRVHAYPGSEIKPEDQHFVIGYIEPYETNKAARGLDLATEPNRRSAAELARDTGLPTVTSKIALIQDDVKSPAFLLYRPIYDERKPLTTIEERRRAIEGFVYAPFSTEAFFNGVLRDRASQMNVVVFEGEQVSPDAAVFASNPTETSAKFDRVTKITLGQKPFTVGWKRAAGFVSSHDTIASWVGFCGALVTLLLSSLVATLQSVSRRAKEIADRTTRELRESQRDLEHASELASAASRAKSEFLANMSHEIRTPINGALGLTEILLRTRLTDEQKELADNVHKSANSLLSIVNDILDFSKIEAGKIVYEDIDFDLRDVVSDLVSVVRFSAEVKKIQLKLAPLPSGDLLFKGDPGRVKQVLLNLLNNAIKFTDSGWVEVRVRVGEESSGRVPIRFEVEDTGIGIPKNSMDQLFREFSQADASTTRRYGGTGLGLSISKKLVEGMKGRMEVASEFGKGSTFSFTLPLKRGQIASLIPKAAKIPPMRATKDVRILLAEDNKVNQLVATKQLQVLGYDVDVVSNGIEAVDAVKKGSYDLVLMDCQMPEMDGFEATRVIRKEARFTKLPIIALTANAFASDRDQCLEAGMSDYVSKPVNVETLGATIAKWISPERLISRRQS